MVTLKAVVALFGFDEKQQFDFVKLVAHLNGFGERFKDKSISALSDTEVNELLNETYATDLSVGVLKLRDAIDKKLLRAQFKEEKVGNVNTKDDFLNLLRWLSEPVKLEKDNKDGAEILEIFKSLKLIGTVKWPTVTPHFIIMHGGMEKNVRPRVDFLLDHVAEMIESDLSLAKKELTFEYATNPRMLFNMEESFAEIVAEDIFEYKGSEALAAIKKIQVILKAHEDFKKSNKNWLEDPDGLKKLILETLGEKSWPENKNSSYYQNSEAYEQSAKNGAKARPSPKGLPTAIDLVNHLIKKRAQKTPGKFDNIKVVPGYAYPPGRVATTEDNVNNFLIKNYDELMRLTKAGETCQVVLVSNNSGGSHYIQYQHIQAEEMIAQFEEKHGIKFNIKIHTVGPGDDKIINLTGAADTIARTIFAKSKRILQTLKVQEEKAVVKTEKLEMLSERIGLFSMAKESQPEDGLAIKSMKVSIR